MAEQDSRDPAMSSTAVAIEGTVNTGRAIVPFSVPGLPPFDRSAADAGWIAPEPPGSEAEHVENVASVASDRGRSNIDAPSIAPHIEESQFSASSDAHAAEMPEPAHARGSRFGLLAASLVIAAAFGGMAGALSAYAVLRPAPAS